MSTVQLLQQSNHHPQALAQTGSPASADAATGSASSGAALSGNAFLALLVTELKNQDPTANTDPNAYVDQLVQVNSLQQLIQINQNIGSVTGSRNTGTPSGQTVTHATSTTPSLT